MAVTIDRAQAGREGGLSYRGLRAWLEEIDRMGQLRRVHGANAEEEIGAATDVLQHAAESPAALFDQNPGDGGRYIGTGSFDITRDPDDGWVNVGTYRVMVHDARRLGYYISPGKHGRLHRQKYFDRGQKCPVAMVFGSEPLQFLASCTEIPYGVSELAWVGGVAGEPVRVIRGPVTGLPIPADAEIVIEGF